MSVTWKLHGAPDMERKLKKIAKEFPDRVAVAVYAESQIEMIESKKRCPVSPTAEQFRMMGKTMPKGLIPGTLRNSGTVSAPEKRGNFIECVLSYGGAAQDYAVVQHERLDFFHTTGQAKYLESVLNESRPYMAARLAERLHLDKTKL